jgi:hypothetical protein
MEFVAREQVESQEEKESLRVAEREVRQEAQTR